MNMINLEFDGYWLDRNKSGIPSKAGIYCVYTCLYNKSENTVSIRNLVYIGEATDVNNRISNHEKLDRFLAQCSNDEVICYSFAPVLNQDRAKAEAALIYKHKPFLNDEYKYNYPFPSVRISITGKTAFLYSDFTI